MKTAEHSTTAPTLQAKQGNQPFFQKEGESSFFSEGSKDSAFFGGSSSGESPKPFFSPSTIQAKLTIGQPGDKYEQEADAMADQVVQRLASGAVQRQCTDCAQEDEGKGIAPKLQPKSIFESNEDQPVQEKLQRKCAACEAKRIQPVRVQRMSGEEEPELQAKSDTPGIQASSDLESRLNATKGGGSPLPAETQSSMDNAFGTDFSGVRVHTNSGAVQMNQELGAQAFTHGSDVYFNSGKYSPGSTEGQRLLGHELTHVVQQGGGVNLKLIQCDFAPQTLAPPPNANGTFEFDMTTREGLLATPPPAGAKSGVEGNIRFEPVTTAPYSNEITLIQIVKLTNSGTGSNVDSGSMVPGRNVRTTEDVDSGVEGGFLTDVEHRRAGVDAPAGSALAPQYPFGPAGSPGGRQIIGFKRSNDPADIKKAELFDFPGTTSTAHNLDFEFETVAKGEDTQTVYGSLAWGFGIRAGDVVNEHVEVANSQSATFDEALELHRDFYVHEPVIFYFGFDRDDLEPTEIAKIDSFLDYLNRFPDVQLSLTGFADRRGNPDYNIDLSLRRAENVKQALIDKGIDEGKIDDIILGMGATEEHTSGDRAPNAGQGQDLESNRRGNRRVELTFAQP